MKQFWRSLWQDKDNPFHEVTVRRDPNPVDSVDVPATMKVLSLPKIFSLTGVVMIRDDYGEAMRDIEGHSTSYTRNVVIVGHPGIGRTMGSIGQAWVLIYTSPYLGKTIFLYYILVRRLLEQKQTILQIDSDHLFFFNANGVNVLPPSFLMDPELEIYQNTWALVDINREIQTPAVMLCRDTSPFFVVMASSPRPSRLRGLQKYRGPDAYWLMKSFTLAELIQASVF